MGDHPFAEKTAGPGTMFDVGSQTGQTVQSGLDAAKEAGGGAGAAGSPFFGALGGLGLISGGLTVGKGIEEMLHGEYRTGGYDMLSGGATMIQGGTALATPMVEASSALGGLLGPIGGAAGVFGGGLQIGKGIAEAQNGDGLTGGLDITQGGLNAVAGGATMLGAAPVAAVAGAGALGMTVGKAMGDIADSDATRTGFWGVDPNTGKNYSAMDAAANWGLDYDREHGVAPGDWSWGGAARAAIGGIGAGVDGTIQAGWNAAADW